MDNSENTSQPIENAPPGGAAKKKPHPFVHGSSQSGSGKLPQTEIAGESKATPAVLPSGGVPDILQKSNDASQPLSMPSNSPSQPLNGKGDNTSRPLPIPIKEGNHSRPLPKPIKPANASQPLPLPIKPANASLSIAPHKRENSASHIQPSDLPSVEADIFLDLNLEDSKAETLSSDILDCVPDADEFDPLSNDFDVASLVAALKEDTTDLPPKTEVKINAPKQDSEKAPGESTDKEVDKKNNFQVFRAPNVFKSVVPQKNSEKSTRDDAKQASKSQPLAASPNELNKVEHPKDSDKAHTDDAKQASKSQPLAASPNELNKVEHPKDSDKATTDDADKKDNFQAFRKKPIFKSNTLLKESEKAPTQDADEKDTTKSADAFLATESHEKDSDTSAEFSVSAGLLAIGAVVQQRYKIIDVIGEGGFATVYRARDIKEDRDIALKVMDPKKGIDTTYTERFFREAKIASKIHHKNVVSIYDFDRIEETGQPYIAMELLKGHALNDEITENGPLTPKRAFTLFRPVLDALATGHHLGIIHKDLKPENLYLVSPGTPQESLKILDFGVARIQSEATRLTSDGLIFGTPRYLAPEYIRSQMVSPAVDVYQMALIFSEVLTGIPAVSGEPYQVMMLHCAGQIEIANYLLEGAVGSVFRKALSIHPEDRYPDCEAFGKAFDSIAEFFTSDKVLENKKQLMSSPKQEALGQPLDDKPESADETNPKEEDTSDSKPNHDASQKEDIENPEAPQPLEKVEPDKKLELKNKLESKPLYLYIGLGSIILILVILLIIILSISSSKEETPEQSAEPQATAATDTVIEFSFTTDPPGARVIRGGAFPVCSPTPCKAQFHESDLNLAQLIDFELDGYRIAHYELKKTSYEETKGMIHVALTKEERISTVTFTINYEPTDAIVTEVESQNVVCTSSPCTYIFELDRGYVKLKFEADGYHDQEEDLTKRRFDETHGKILVALGKGKRGGRRSSGISGGDVDALCQKAVRAKVNGNKCEAYHLYRRAKKAGIKDALCKRNADSTIAAYAAECNKK